MGKMCFNVLYVKEEEFHGQIGNMAPNMPIECFFFFFFDPDWRADMPHPQYREY